MTFKELTENYIARMNLKLPPQEWTLLCLLISRELVTKEAIYINWWGDNEPDTSNNIFNVKLHHLRKILKPLGIEIICYWGKGYSITKEAKEQLLKYFEKIPEDKPIDYEKIAAPKVYFFLEAPSGLTIGYGGRLSHNAPTLWSSPVVADNWRKNHGKYNEEKLEIKAVRFTKI